LPENVTFAWSGDHRGDSQGISEQLNDIYESINSKHNLLLWEVGGYNFPAPNKYDLINSLKIGALLPMMSNGGRNGGLTNHLPWFHDNETTTIFKKFVDLHYNLMPFFYSETHKYGKNFLLKINPKSSHSYYISNTIVVFNNFYSKNIYKCNFDTNYQWVNILNDEIIKSNYINFESTPNNISTYIKNGSIIPFYNFYQNSDTISFKIYPNKSNSNVFILPLNFEDKNCKVIINYSTKDGYLNTYSNCGKILKINIKSNVEPIISKISTNWYYDNNSKWVTIITDKENLVTKIENFKDYN
jgi:alpha-glucosidase (family GH31 glycosyl hydrolase)